MSKTGTSGLSVTMPPLMTMKPMSLLLMLVLLRSGLL